MFRNIIITKEKISKRHNQETIYIKRNLYLSKGKNFTNEMIFEYWILFFYHGAESGRLEKLKLQKN